MNPYRQQRAPSNEAVPDSGLAVHSIGVGVHRFIRFTFLLRFPSQRFAAQVPQLPCGPTAHATHDQQHFSHPQPRRVHSGNVALSVAADRTQQHRRPHRGKFKYDIDAPMRLIEIICAAVRFQDEPNPSHRPACLE